LSRRAAARLLATAACCAGLLAAAVPGASASAPPSALPASAAALYAPQTGQVLYSVNLDRRVAVASTTKLMTALITLQHVHRLSTMFTQNDWYPAPEDSQLGLVPGERMSVHDLLLALMLPSDDDAAEDLAYNVGHGSVPRFVAMMNAEARKLGLSHTHYSTPIGLDAPGNYSSAGDLVKLAEYDLTHSGYFAHMVGLKSAVVRAGGQVETVTNRNDLVGRFPWIDGVKTGHTTQAGYVLVASAHRNGMWLISAVLGTTSPQERDAASLSLLDYGFGSFIRRTPLRVHQMLGRPAVQDQPGVHAAVVAASGFARILPRSDRLRLQIQVPRQVSGPLPAQAVVGTVSVIDGRRVLARVPLVLAHRLPGVSGLTLAARFVTRPLTLLVIVAAGLGGLFWRGMRRRRRIGQGGEVEAA
jgi:D-alanyl-D-alanine carboxypeptidase (penicillin-binding protein 5/6)